MAFRLIVAALLVLGCPSLAAARGVSPQPPDGIDRLVTAIEDAIRTGDEGRLRALAAPNISQAFDEFTAMMTSPRVTAATVKERDRAHLPGVRRRLMLDILTDRDRDGRVSTWRLDIAPVRLGDPDTPWVIAEIEKLTVVSGLYRLVLNTSREYDVRNLVVQAPDLTLSLPAGHAFFAETSDGPTALVLLGRGRAVFSPKPAAERGQVRIFCGQDALSADFDNVFVRLNPAEFSSRVAQEALIARGVDEGDLRRAQQAYDAGIPLSFQINLSDLSAERWSLVPTGSDFVAEINTRKYGSLTYAQSSNEPEDISLFDRRRRKNISVYASETRLATRGRFFNEDDLADYDVVHYDLATSFAPDRMWIDATARLTIRTRAPAITTMTMRLAEPLVVRSVSSPQFGRLLQLRVVGQNSLLIGFPGTIVGGTEFVLDLQYSGPLEPQALDREALQLTREQSEIMVIPAEPQYVYSNRSFWYPQGMVTDYATARMTITVPAEIDVVASGAPQGPPTILPAGAGQRPRKQFVFETDRPVRYLAWIASRLQGLQVAGIDLPGTGQPFNLFVQANPREFTRARAFADKTTDILKYYASLLEDAPYESFTVTLAESELPGGHSPAYFAIVNQPLPTTPFTWVNDPVAFPNFASFFLAHEIAHQWWGQAVGWKNYHEQWLSEGFAQYFAALWAERERGPEQFTAIIRQMRRTALDTSGQGPVYLGYRLGHIKSDSRVFRSLVYNKGALVLHMLRRLIGDEAFFAGLREFYTKWRFKKAGTDDLRAVMEGASGRPLQKFFTQWIYDSAIPTVRYTSRVEGLQLHLRFEQKTDVCELPTTVTVTYADGTTEDALVLIADKVVERTLPLRGPVRAVDVNRDGAVLANFEK